MPDYFIPYTIVIGATFLFLLTVILSVFKLVSLIQSFLDHTARQQNLVTIILQILAILIYFVIAVLLADYFINNISIIFN